MASLKSNLQNVHDYLYEKYTKHKWKSSLISATLIYFSGRYLYNKLYRKYYSLPPGPEGYIPKIGVLLYTFFNPNWHTYLAMTYGPIVSFYQMNTWVTFINDSCIAKYVLSQENATWRPDFLGNPKIFNLIAADDNTVSFVGLNGSKWTKMRRMMHSKLIRILNTKNVNKIINESLQKELEPELQEIIANNDRIWYPRKILSQLTFNVIFHANLGESVSFKNDKLCQELSSDLVEGLGWNMSKRRIPLFLLPKLAPLIVPKSFFEPVYNIRKKINNNIKQLIQQRRQRNNVNVDDDNMTFMDHTMELAENKNADYTLSQEIADNHLMFVAGTDTTASTMEFGLILLAKQPEIQIIVRNELKSVIKDENFIYDINLLLQLPLFRSLMHEILRISCVSRGGVPHKIVKNDTWITTKDDKKYRIPKGSYIQYNIEYIHYNNKKGSNEHWKNMDKNPQLIFLENWLKTDNDGNKRFYQNESFLSFGFGKRDCIGKSLAIKEMRVILGYLLLNYKFSLPAQYINMTNIPCKGGVRNSVSKPTPQIPIIIQPID